MTKVYSFILLTLLALCAQATFAKSEKFDCAQTICIMSVEKCLSGKGFEKPEYPKTEKDCCARCIECNVFEHQCKFDETFVGSDYNCPKCVKDLPQPAQCLVFNVCEKPCEENVISATDPCGHCEAIYGCVNTTCEADDFYFTSGSLSNTTSLFAFLVSFFLTNVLYIFLTKKS
jgi:hypothetical protein